MSRFILHILFVSNLLALTPFELHNIREARGQNITGAGVEIGIIDNAFNENHQALTGQLLGVEYPQGYTPNFTTDAHGSHVAGIAVANRTNNSSYGIANEAKFYGMGGIGSGLQIPSSFDFFNPINEIKIINNSWGSNTYPAVNLRINPNLQIDTSFTPQSVSGTLRASDFSSGLYELATQKQVLSIFAAGNEGILSPNIQAVAPRYDESLRSWLAVGALDSNHIERRNDGILVVSGRGIADFSNGFIGAENFSLVAAGVDINSVDSSTASGYTSKQGTSMAAPAISGIAALVSQQFPFLNGKQIADVLLSTANRDYEAPKMTVKQVQTDNTQNNFSYLIVYIDTQIPTEAEIRDDLRALYANQAIIVGGQQIALDEHIWNNRDNIQNPNATIQGTMQVRKEDLFGQGIADAFKAIKGLGEIDINRLSDADAQEKDGVKEAFYTLNVSSDAIFENDISQKKWDDTLHLNTALNLPTSLQGLNAGFIKEGSATLTFRGANTYEGATIIRNGELRLEKRADDTGGSIAGNVFVEQNAKLNILGATTQVSTPTQSASIAKDLINEGGTVSIGERGLGLLSVTGTYTQKNSGILQLSFNSLGNSKLEANSYTIESGELQYRPLEAQFSTTPQTIVIDLKQELKDVLNNFTDVSVLPSNVLDYTLMADRFTLQIIGRPDAYGNILSANLSLAAALRSIASLLNEPSTPTEYRAFFNNFLNTTQVGSTDYENSLKSLDSDGYLKHSSKIFSLQDKNALKTLLHLYEGDDENFALSPNYHYGVSKDESFWGFGAKLRAKKTVPNANLAGYLGYDDLSSSFEYSTLRSKILSAGLVSASSLSDYLQFILGLHLGFSQNELERQIYPTNTRLKGTYQNIFASIQLGFAQDYELRSMLDTNLAQSAFVLTPLAYLSYKLAYQDAFKEDGQLFAKSYDQGYINSLSANAGFNLRYNFLKNFDSADLNLYSVYERLLSEDELRNEASFKDFANYKFTQQKALAKDKLRFGVNLSNKFGRGFFSLGLDNELSKDEYSFNILGKVGFSF
ncbi:S8 family serine peptidase [Campylobacter troglodytis]|uniref:S8 family serine peptidase n=1 Tax=Campylobacter troglodytis TaxID=654363 RepID=UPI00163BBA9D|nr:S8 family serine peptidase [Campylobacter troglodytis]